MYFVMLVMLCYYLYVCLYVCSCMYLLMLFFCLRGIQTSLLIMGQPFVWGQRHVRISKGGANSAYIYCRQDNMF